MFLLVGVFCPFNRSRVCALGKKRRRKRLYFYGQIEAFAFRRSRSEEKINWTSSLLARALRSERRAGGSHVFTWNVALYRDCISRYISFFFAHPAAYFFDVSLSISLYRDCEQYIHIRVKERKPSSLDIRFSHSKKRTLLVLVFSALIHTQVT